jgi:cellulose synthase/poly-beta-1,6-N-acetylglucosamine synthase-like glycosyltransferase
MAADLADQIACSIGITAYNEETNIGRLLEAVVSQRLDKADLKEIIVVASGCTDGTEAVVQEWAARDPRIRLIVQARREGKASAVNVFLSQAQNKVLLLASADLLPALDTIEQVVAPFADPEVAMTTCRPVPINDPGCFMGFAAHMLWNLHHQINLVDFKAGELIAFRKVFERIPTRTAVDEASVESVIRGQGYGVRYVGTAVTYNKGPDTVRDFLRQRRRIHAGHLALRDGVGYRVATLSGLRILALVLRHMEWRPRPLVWTWTVAALEAYGRLLGKRDYKKRRDHSVWEIAKTTKQLEAARAKGTVGAVGSK